MIHIEKAQKMITTIHIKYDEAQQHATNALVRIVFCKAWHIN